MRKWHISLSNIPDGGLLQGERIYILNTDFMSLRDAIVTFEFYSSCGFHVLLRYFAIEKLRERSFQLVYFAREEYLIANRLIVQPIIRPEREVALAPQIVPIILI